MLPLEQLQSEFIAMLNGNSHRIPFSQASCGTHNTAAKNTPRKHISTEKSEAIYRRNYRENHLQALTDTYENTAALVGKHYFRQLAARYLAAHPHSSGDLNDYGDTFANHLDAILPHVPHGETLPYLPDIARLDWAILKALRAPRSRNQLAELLSWPVAKQQQARCQLHSACTIISSRYPLYALWKLIQRDDAPVDLSLGGETILVCRPDNNVQVYRLNHETAYFLQQWQTHTFADSLIQLNQHHPNANVANIIENINRLAVIDTLWR